MRCTPTRKLGPVVLAGEGKHARPLRIPRVVPRRERKAQTQFSSPLLCAAAQPSELRIASQRRGAGELALLTRERHDAGRMLTNKSRLVRAKMGGADPSFRFSILVN